MSRWTGLEGEARALSAMAWLGSGEGDEAQFGLTSDGLVDLRGLRLPEVQVVGEARVGGLSWDVLSEVLEISGRRLVDVDLSNSVVPHLRLFDCELDGCVVQHAHCQDWRLWRCDVQNTSFAGTDLRGSLLGGDGTSLNTWVKVSFDGADLRDCGFADSIMTQCSFRDTKFLRPQFVRMHLTDCIFTGRLKTAMFVGSAGTSGVRTSPFTRVDFTGSIFEDVAFVGCRFDEVLLPTAGGVWAVESFPPVARRMLALLESDVSSAAEELRFTLEHAVRYDATDDTVCVFNDSDLARWGGENLVRLTHQTFELASKPQE